MYFVEDVFSFVNPVQRVTISLLICRCDRAPMASQRGGHMLASGREMSAGLESGGDDPPSSRQFRMLFPLVHSPSPCVFAWVVRVCLLGNRAHRSSPQHQLNGSALF